MYSRQKFLIEKEIDKIKNKMIEYDWFIAGGAITSVFTGQRINDLDIYFCNKEAFNSQIELCNTNKEVISFQTDNAISLPLNGVKVQFIKIFFGTPENVLKEFDFSICMGAYIPKSKSFILDSSFLEDNALKTIRFNTNIKYPISSLYRIKKYLKRKYSFPAVEIIKLALSIHKLNIKTYRDLKEQLEGIDTLILKELTDSLLAIENKEFDFKEFLIYIDTYLNKFYEGDD